jgi:selenide,water dikinase
MIQKSRVLLVGCGHANLQVLHHLGKIKKDLNISLIVISDVLEITYSGMLPGYLMGIYQHDEFHFNLVSICQKYNVELICDAVSNIDFRNQEVLTLNGKKISYDYCSINIGSVPRSIHQGTPPYNLIYVKPISPFIKKMSDIKSTLPEKPIIFILGGGAAGFEIAVAASILFPLAKLGIVSGSDGLLQGQNKLTRRLAKKILEERNIQLFDGLTAQSEGDGLKLSNGKLFNYDLALVAVSASPVHQVQSQEFFSVNSFLQVEGFSKVFAAGDCSYFKDRPLPKAGVFAVREGLIVAQNIERSLKFTALKRYRPQKWYLVLMLCGIKEVILSWGPLAFKSRWFWYLKNMIDRRFMKKFQ